MEDTLCDLCGSEQEDTVECNCCGEPICEDCLGRHNREVDEEIRIARCQDMEEMGRDGFIDFANPGSALRAETPTNPRNLPCPTCGQSNTLTPEDVALHYQCDTCAARTEGTYMGADY